MTWLAVALGAALGAPARFHLDAFVTRRSDSEIPLGTFVVNLSGAAALGVLAALLSKGVLTPSGFALFGTGFCGAYTTFSTFVWETIVLAEERRPTLSLANVALTVALGVGVLTAAFLTTNALA